MNYASYGSEGGDTNNYPQIMLPLPSSWRIIWGRKEGAISKLWEQEGKTAQRGWENTGVCWEEHLGCLLHIQYSSPLHTCLVCGIHAMHATLAPGPIVNTSVHPDTKPLYSTMLHPYFGVQHLVQRPVHL